MGAQPAAVHAIVNGAPMVRLDNDSKTWPLVFVSIPLLSHHVPGTLELRLYKQCMFWLDGDSILAAWKMRDDKPIEWRDVTLWPAHLLWIRNL